MGMRNRVVDWLNRVTGTPALRQELEGLRRSLEQCQLDLLGQVTGTAVLRQEVEEFRQLFEQWKIEANGRTLDGTALIEPYRVEGTDNRILVVDNGAERELTSRERFPGLNIEIVGDNNVIRLETPINFVIGDFRIYASGTQINIEPSPQLHLVVSAWAGNNQRLHWGRDSDTSWEVKVYLGAENAAVRVGRDVMFAGEINLWPAESHAILDRETGEVLNQVGSELVIGDHSWIGQGVRMTKNARVPAHTIVGINSVVTKSFTEEYTAIAGNPARVVRTGVVWDRRPPQEHHRGANGIRNH